MLNKLYDTVEEVLESVDAGGEQSRVFAEGIKMLKDILTTVLGMLSTGWTSGRWNGPIPVLYRCSWL